MDHSGGHRIRLHSVWTRTESAADGSELAVTRLSLPDNLPLDPATTMVTYRRAFNAPPNLDPTAQVYFDSELAVEEAVIQVNGVRTKPLSPRVVDLTPHLQAHNEIEIRLAGSAITIVNTATASLRICD